MLTIQAEQRLIAYYIALEQTGGVSTFGFQLELARNTRFPGPILDGFWLPNGETQPIHISKRKGNVEPHYLPNEIQMILVGDVSSHLRRADKVFAKASDVIEAYYGIYGQSFSSCAHGRMAAIYVLTPSWTKYIVAVNTRRSKTGRLNLSKADMYDELRSLVKDRTSMRKIKDMMDESIVLYSKACAAYIGSAND